MNDKRNWHDAADSMKRVPTWYTRRLLMYVFAAMIICFLTGVVLGLIISHG